MEAHAIIRSSDKQREAAPDTTAWISDGEPLWDQIPFDVLCSRCDYNLRGLKVPRCPECGLEFTWHEIFHTRLHQSDFLFEHQWQQRPIRAWLATVWRSLRPRRFWDSVSIHSAIRPKALWVMLASTVLLFCAAFYGAALVLARLSWFVHYSLHGNTHSGMWRRGAVWQPPCTFLNTSRILSAMADPRDYDDLIRVVSFVTIAWLATLGLICLLDDSLARCRVRRVQVLRVVAYSAGPTNILVASVAALFFAASLFLNNAPGLSPNLAMILPIGILLGLALLATPYLWVALGRYLRLSQAGLIAFLAVLVGVLTSAVSSIILVWL